MKKRYMTPIVDTVVLDNVRLLDGGSNTPTEVPVDPTKEGDPTQAESRWLATYLWDDESEDNYDEDEW